METGRESGELTRLLIKETCIKQDIDSDQLTIHSDRGSAMKAKTLSHLYADLGISKSFSRPHVSDDNPFSESHFKTLKYRLGFPNRFGCPEDAKHICQEFFTSYNRDYRHIGIGLLTPEVVQYGLAGERIAQQNQVLQAACQAHPERFVKLIPVAPQLPETVRINPPNKSGGIKGNLP